jgi:hypothetical protein
MATRTLSPKRTLECSAVAVLAMQSARWAVQAQIRANGQKIAQFSAREISVLAEAHLAQPGAIKGRS